jgi:uncharacterized protein (TIGR01777 family)
VVRLDRSGHPGAGSLSWNPEAGTFDRAALDAAGPFGALVNLAGAGIGDRRWTPARKRIITQSRVRSTELAVRLVAEAGIPVLVNASAVGYYGDRGDEELTEVSTAGTGFLAEVCQAWEAAAAPAAESGARVVCLRSGIVLSAHGGALARQLPLFRLGLGGRLGSGRQFTSWITLADEVAVICRAIDDPELAGPVNAVAPGAVTNAEFTAALAAAVHRPAVLGVPRAALAVALGSEMADQLLLASQRVRPARLETVGHSFAHPELAGALKDVLAG